MLRYMRTVVNRALLGLLAAGLLAGCAGGAGEPAAEGTDAEGTDTGAVRVVAAVYPLAFLAEAVGGSAVQVATLTPPGVEPHDLELTAEQVIAIKQADLILRVPGMAAIDQAVAQNNPQAAVDLTAGVDLLPLPGEEQATATDYDPHLWLDPANMTTMGRSVAAAIVRADPAAQSATTAGQKQLGAQMQQLDSDFRSGTRTCGSRDLVVTHEAFGYLARAYDFTQHALAGVSPQSEPSPARLAEITDLVREKGITTIYFEVLVSPDVARTVAASTGAQTAVLDPIEGNTDDVGYEGLMRANLAALVAGQGCS